MADNIEMTPVSKATVWTSFVLVDNQAVPISGTFNSLTRNVSTGGILNDRQFFRAYADAAGASGRLASSYNFSLPSDYVAGTDIKVRPVWTSAVAAGSACFWELGLTDLDGSDIFGGTTETEWQTVVSGSVGAGSVFHSIQMAEQTFSGTGFTKDKPLNLITARDSGNGSDDLGDTAYIFAVEIIYQRSEAATVSNGVNKEMTPLQHAPLFRDVFYSMPLVESDSAGTYDGIACSAASVFSVNSRTAIREFTASVNRAFQFNWIVPPDYKTGGIIKVTVLASPDNTDTGNTHTYMGLTTDTLGSEFGDETDTEYLNSNENPIPMNGTINFVQSNFYTFSGTNQNATEIAAGDPISFIHVRQGGAGADTFTGGFETCGVLVQYESNKGGIL